MSESEDLKASAERTKSLDKVRAMSEYLDRLTDRIDKAFARERDSMIIYWIVWFCWIAAGFISKEVNSLFELFFIGALIYSGLRTTERARAVGEFRGAIKTLEILGMIPPKGSGEREEKKKHFWEEGIDMVKSWSKKKAEKQEEAYAPA